MNSKFYNFYRSNDGNENQGKSKAILRSLEIVKVRSNGDIPTDLEDIIEKLK